MYRAFVPTAIALLLAAQAPAASPRSDFEDGTAQGWTLSSPSRGVLAVAAGGNPGYCLSGTDTLPASAPLLAQAPAQFTGDLSSYESIRWDELVVDFGASTVLGTSAYIRSANGTLWTSSAALEGTGSWTTRVAPFVESAWTMRSGSESFATVLTHVDALFISMDTSRLDHSALESEIDNVALVRPTETAVPATTTSSWGNIRVLARHLANL